jgi:hypothetical protein
LERNEVSGATNCSSLDVMRVEVNKVAALMQNSASRAFFVIFGCTCCNEELSTLGVNSEIGKEMGGGVFGIPEDNVNEWGASATVACKWSIFGFSCRILN